MDMRRGFTLIELSVVITIITLVVAGGMVTLVSGVQQAQYNATVATMDAIEKALLNYSVAFGRLPCPADLTATAGSTSYGVEAGVTTGGTGTGECKTGMTPAANYISASGTEEGGVPTRALRLPDSFMYDGWGRRFRYAVDPNYTVASTASGSTVLSNLSSPSPKAITVYDATGAARTKQGMYVLLSHGANGHGGFTAKGIAFNAQSTNADELVNCHCLTNGTAGTYAPTYVQKAPSITTTTNLTTGFDDIVAFKDGWQMQTLNNQLTSSSPLLYVADTQKNRVVILTTSGVFLKQITGFNKPQKVVVDINGNLWVSDDGNNAIKEYDASGNYKGTAAGYTGTNPTAMAFDPSGNLWVISTGDGYIYKLSSTGAYISKFQAVTCVTPSCTSPVGGKFDQNGPGYGPEYIASDISGNIWITDYAHYWVQKFSNSYSYITFIGGSAIGSGSGQFQSAHGIVIDQSNNIYVADPVNLRINKFNVSGAVVNSFSSGTKPYLTNAALSSPYDLSVDSSGNIWIYDAVNNNVQEYSSTGVVMQPPISSFNSGDSFGCCDVNGIGATGITVAR